MQYILPPYLSDMGVGGDVHMTQSVGVMLCFIALIPILLYSALILIGSTVQNKSLWVGILSVPAAFVQLMGYGFGFLKAWWLRIVLGKSEFAAFEKNFYD